MIVRSELQQVIAFPSKEIKASAFFLAEAALLKVTLPGPLSLIATLTYRAAAFSVACAM